MQVGWLTRAEVSATSGYGEPASHRHAGRSFSYTFRVNTARPSVSPLVAAVLLTALTAASPCAQSPPPASPVASPAEDRLLFEGIAVGKPDSAGGLPSLLRFELLRADSSVVLTPLGQASIETNPLSGFPELPAPPDSVVPLRVSARSLLMMANQVEGALAGAPPENVLGFSVVDGHVRFRFERGAPLVILGLLGFVLVAGSAGATTFVLWRRETRRRVAALDAQRRQIDAAEAERVRIAREIHDGPLQDLHAARARAEVSQLAEGDSSGPASAVTAAAIAADVTEIARNLRAIAEGLRPPALGRFGLPAALASHAARVAERHPHVRVHVTADEAHLPLAPAAEASLFRIVQEAITNAVRHGQARAVEVEYAVEPSPETPEQVCLVVRDDGVGLPTGLDRNTLVAGGHFGLAGMAERAALLGGEFSVTPNTPGPGATVRVVAPWASVVDVAP